MGTPPASRVQHLLYHDPVVQTGEACCVTVMTEYEKGIQKRKNHPAFLLIRHLSHRFVRERSAWLHGLDDNSLKQWRRVRSTRGGAKFFKKGHANLLLGP